MRTSYQSTTSRPSPSGPNATRGRRAGRSTAAATTRGSSSPGPGKSSSACRNSAARPSGRLPSSATAGARPLSRRLSSRCTWRASQPRGSRTSPSSSGGGAGVHREDGERRVRRDTGLHGIPAGALAPDQDGQRDRTHRPRDQEEDEGVGTYPDGNSVVILVSARLKYIAEHEWGKRRYLDMSKLEQMDELKGKAEG